jgi:hypothetical protein
VLNNTESTHYHVTTSIATQINTGAKFSGQPVVGAADLIYPSWVRFIAFLLELIRLISDQVDKYHHWDGNRLGHFGHILGSQDTCSEEALFELLALVYNHLVHNS